jgi:uncharacterized protein YcgI (DUF1989 family)
MAMSEAPRDVLEDATLRPGDDWARVVRRGERLRIVDL